MALGKFSPGCNCCGEECQTSFSDFPNANFGTNEVRNYSPGFSSPGFVVRFFLHSGRARLTVQDKTIEVFVDDTPDVIFNGVPVADLANAGLFWLSEPGTGTPYGPYEVIVKVTPDWSAGIVKFASQIGTIQVSDEPATSATSFSIEAIGSGVTISDVYAEDVRGPSASIPSGCPGVVTLPSCLSNVANRNAGGGKGLFPPNVTVTSGATHLWYGFDFFSATSDWRTMDRYDPPGGGSTNTDQLYFGSVWLSNQANNPVDWGADHGPWWDATTPPDLPVDTQLTPWLRNSCEFSIRLEAVFSHYTRNNVFQPLIMFGDYEYSPAYGVVPFGAISASIVLSAVVVQDAATISDPYPKPKLRLRAIARNGASGNCSNFLSAVIATETIVEDVVAINSSGDIPGATVAATAPAKEVSFSCTPSTFTRGGIFETVTVSWSP